MSRSFFNMVVACLHRNCALSAPFDFTASGAYAQGKRRKNRSNKAPFVLSVAPAKSKHSHRSPVHYAEMRRRRASRVRSAHQHIRCTSAPYDLLGGVT